MGCGESKSADVQRGDPRKPVAAVEKGYEPPEVTIPTPIQAPKPLAPAPAPSPVTLPIPASVSASLPKKTSSNQGIYATSTDRRTQEVEFFRNIVKRTEECVGTESFTIDTCFMSFCVCSPFPGILLTYHILLSILMRTKRVSRTTDLGQNSDQSRFSPSGLISAACPGPALKTKKT
jgi:hypothetical protein